MRRRFEAADGFASAFAFASFAVQVVARGGVVAGLRDRDPVESRVQLAVAATIEPVTLCSA
jgi:hypothetical protein